MKSKRCYICDRVAHKESYSFIKAHILSESTVRDPSSILNPKWIAYSGVFQFEKKVDFVVCYSCGEKIFKKNLTTGIITLIVGLLAVISSIISFNLKMSYVGGICILVALSAFTWSFESLRAYLSGEKEKYIYHRIFQIAKKREKGHMKLFTQEAWDKLPDIRGRIK